MPAFVLYIVSVNNSFKMTDFCQIQVLKTGRFAYYYPVLGLIIIHTTGLQSY